MISAAQVAVPSGTSVALPPIPPGAQVALSVPSGTIYLGGTSAVTSSTGAPLSGYVPLPANPPTGSTTALWAIAASGTVATGFIVTTPR